LDWGQFNVFVIDIANPTHYIQLTHDKGANENPSWAPDGKHLVFSRGVGRSQQIFVMLANGQRVKQLTNAGQNEQPVWAPAIKD